MDASESGIEVTKEMQLVGAHVLRNHPEMKKHVGAYRPLADEVYRAMFRAGPLFEGDDYDR